MSEPRYVTQAISDFALRVGSDDLDGYAADRQTLLTEEPLGFLAVDRDAVTTQQDVQPSVTEPPALLRQLA